MTLADFTDEEIIAEYERRIKSISVAKRKKRDRERYIRNRDNILRRSSEYYRDHREEILEKKRSTGNVTYGSLKAIRQKKY